ncbi:MAG: AtpZ/AtpI family protein [Gammaproteobacteria bacterium]|jgi:ATP synthase protein I|nr:AtpZ/AtpI family protein [Gammaproteobacteria bacterium]MBP6052437.1 AtpZ/AtpI family protein [Pseudomonadales bacterium]MBK6583178.1 AtpZ/AtpI family protein [Gammaproteobacteria bacterium]MBK7170641.1 AtpZ/AtpI family protein [Gammaproteobacteria bacterium]MBK7519312.1 AtpZ/AtpI family protein [Gammaproteobacteria bacterium]
MTIDEREKQQLEKRIANQARRIHRARREHNTMLAELAHFGSLGFLFVIPVVIGAYLGSWLDGRYTGFQTSWTVSLILLGVTIGIGNVYLFIKDKD